MDNISKKISAEMLLVYQSQNILQLSEWFVRFPNAIEILEYALEEAPIKHAIRECLWLSLAFLLNVPIVTRKAKQVATAKSNNHPICPIILKCHINKNEGSQIELMKFLHARVRL